MIRRKVLKFLYACFFPIYHRRMSCGNTFLEAVADSEGQLNFLIIHECSPGLRSKERLQVNSNTSLPTLTIKKKKKSHQLLLRNQMYENCQSNLNSKAHNKSQKYWEQLVILKIVILKARMQKFADLHVRQLTSLSMARTSKFPFNSNHSMITQEASSPLTQKTRTSSAYICTTVLDFSYPRECKRRKKKKLNF